MQVLPDLPVCLVFFCQVGMDIHVYMRERERERQRGRETERERSTKYLHIVNP